MIQIVLVRARPQTNVIHAPAKLATSSTHRPLNVMVSAELYIFYRLGLTLILCWTFIDVSIVIPNIMIVRLQVSEQCCFWGAVDISHHFFINMVIFAVVRAFCNQLTGWGFGCAYIDVPPDLKVGHSNG